MSDSAQLFVPALRWDRAHGFGHLQDIIDEALALGVGGFLVCGGSCPDVEALVAGLHARSRVPLLIAADVERGAGQQFDGCTALPPFGALASLASLSAGADREPAAVAVDVVRRAARATARDMKRLGLNWALAPVCDIDLQPLAPIVGTRAAGSDAVHAGCLVSEWIDACQAEGVLACAKHFPGHGRANADSHLELPVVREGAEHLRRTDLAPFRAAVDAGVASVMTAHVAYPALDASLAPASLSAPIITELLRREMGFDGLVVSDALDMAGVRANGQEDDVVVRAVSAGCDVLLGPWSVAGAVHAIDRALEQGAIGDDHLRAALDRRARWALWARPGGSLGEPTLDDVMWARQVADRTIFVVRGSLPIVGPEVEVVEVDDDEDGTWLVPDRSYFTAALRALDIHAAVVREPTRNVNASVVVAAYADVIAGKGTASLSDHGRAAVERAIAVAASHRRPALVVLFSHPHNAAAIPFAANVLCVWGGERPMQEAAARVLVRGLSSG